MEKVLATLKSRGTNQEVLLIQCVTLEVLAMLKELQKISTLLLEAGTKSFTKGFTLSQGGLGGLEVSDPRSSHFEAPHSP